MRVLVCGGRNYDDTIRVGDVLHELHLATPFSLLIEGGANGADSIARQWAALAMVDSVSVFADWSKHGRAAGPMRNQRMLDQYGPDLVVAFPGGRGTKDMIMRAKKAGVRVIEVAPVSTSPIPPEGK